MASLDDLQTDLDSVTTAIRRIEGALTQEFWEGGDRHRAPELDRLYQRQERLRQQIDNVNRGGAKLRPIRFVN